MKVLLNSAIHHINEVSNAIDQITSINSFMNKLKSLWSVFGSFLSRSIGMIGAGAMKAIKYLNREKDARQFAYPVIYNEYVDMSSINVNPETEDEIFHLFIISSTYAILSLIALVVITSIIWGINYIRKLKHRRSTLNSKIQNPLSKLVPQNSILRKQYLKYGIQRLCSYLLIGLMSASFVGGPLGMLSGAIPVIISSIVCSINDLKALKNPLEDQFIVFTKSYVIVVLVLLTVNFCWLLFYYLLILSY
jgi:hypothetical protein